VGGAVVDDAALADALAPLAAADRPPRPPPPPPPPPPVDEGYGGYGAGAYADDDDLT